MRMCYPHEAKYGLDMMCKHTCSQMNVAVAAMIAGYRRHWSRDHAVTRIHDTFISIPGAGHVPQMQLINDTDPATGVRYLELAIAFFIETMDLKHAECPTKVSPAAP